MSARGGWSQGGAGPPAAPDLQTWPLPSPEPAPVIPSSTAPEPTQPPWHHTQCPAASVLAASVFLQEKWAQDKVVP